MAISFGNVSQNKFVNSSVSTSEYEKFLTNPTGHQYGIFTNDAACYVPYGSDYGFIRRAINSLYGLVNLKDGTESSYNALNLTNFMSACKVKNLQNSYIWISSSAIAGLNSNTEYTVKIADIDVNTYSTIGPAGGQGVISSDSSNFIIYLPRINGNENYLLRYTIKFNGEISSETTFEVTNEVITLTNTHGQIESVCGVYGDICVISYKDGYIQIGDNAYCDYFVGSDWYLQDLRTKEEDGFDKIYGMTYSTIDGEYIVGITANSSLSGKVNPDFIIKTNDTFYGYYPICPTNNSIYCATKVKDNDKECNIINLTYDGKVRFIETISLDDAGNFGRRYTGFGVDFDETMLTAISDTFDDGESTTYTIKNTTN